MVHGRHFYLVWDTEIHALCGRGHRTLDRKQPIYELAERVRGEGRSYWDDRTDDRGSPDCRISDRDGVRGGRGYGLRYVPLDHVVRFQHAWDHSEKLDRFPDRLDVVRSVSAEGHCAACRVPYAASRIFVAVTCANGSTRPARL